MSLWQLELFLIPKQRLCERFGGQPAIIREDLLQDFAWWSCAEPHGIDAELSKLFSEAPSWSSDIRIWGDERGDAALVIYEDETHKNVVEISFYIDVRRLSLSVIQGICDLAQRFDCVFIASRTYQVVAPDADSVRAAIERSFAKRFVADPRSALESLPEGTAETKRLRRTGEPEEQ